MEEQSGTFPKWIHENPPRPEQEAAAMEKEKENLTGIGSFIGRKVWQNGRKYW